MKKHTFLSGSLISMIEQGFSSLTSFLTGIIIARECEMATAGTYALVLSIAMIALGLQRVVIAVPFNVHYPQYPAGKEKQRYFSATVGIEFLFLAVAAVIAVLMGHFVWPMVGGVFCAVFFVGYLFKDYGRQLFFGIGKVANCLVMSLTQCVLQIGILVILKSGLTLQGILMVIGVSCIFCTGVFLFPYAKMTFKKEDIIMAWRKNWWTAKWSIGISMSDSVKNQLSVWLLKIFQSTEAVAIYNNNNTLATLPQPVFLGLSQYLLPNLSSSIHRDNKRKIFLKIYGTCGIAASINLLWSIGLIFAGQSLIGYLYGESYFVGIAPLLVCCIRGIFVSLNNIQNAVLQAYGKPQIILYTLVAGVAFLATGGTLLIWQGGIMGAGLAMLFVYMIPVILQACEIVKIGKEKG